MGMLIRTYVSDEQANSNCELNGSCPKSICNQLVNGECARYKRRCSNIHMCEASKPIQTSGIGRYHRRDLSNAMFRPTTT